MSENPVMHYVRQKFVRFRQLIDEVGMDAAREKMFEGYPERQKQQMGSFIDDNTLAGGFEQAIPLFAQMGMDMSVVDISNAGRDAVLEIQRACPFMPLAAEYGFERPCIVICELDVAATKMAFPGMAGRILSKQADGDCVCMFKYERDAKA